MATRVEIVDYDPQWPVDFERLSAVLRKRLAPMVVAIDHVGSTSVPGLAAKPVIDIDVTLEEAGHMAEAAQRLEAAGFEPRPDRYRDGMRAFLLRAAKPVARVYICLPGNETHRARMIFRNCLRANPVLAGAYARLKRDLAVRFSHDGDAYTAAKREFIEGILESSRHFRE